MALVGAWMVVSSYDLASDIALQLKNLISFITHLACDIYNSVLFPFSNQSSIGSIRFPWLKQPHKIIISAISKHLQVSPITFSYNTNLWLLIMQLDRLLRHCTNFVNGVILAADLVDVLMACCFADAALFVVVTGRSAAASCWHFEASWHQRSGILRLLIIQFFTWHILRVKSLKVLRDYNLTNLTFFDFDDDGLASR